MATTCHCQEPGGIVNVPVQRPSWFVNWVAAQNTSKAPQPSWAWKSPTNVTCVKAVVETSSWARARLRAGFAGLASACPVEVSGRNMPISMASAPKRWSHRPADDIAWRRGGRRYAPRVDPVRPNALMVAITSLRHRCARMGDRARVATPRFEPCPSVTYVSRIALSMIPRPLRLVAIWCRGAPSRTAPVPSLPAIAGGSGETPGRDSRDGKGMRGTRVSELYCLSLSRTHGLRKWLQACLR